MVIQIIPCSSTVFAVFTDSDGKPVFEMLACLGLVDLPGKRLVCGMSMGDHIEPADGKMNFVGYSSDTKPERWVKPCKSRKVEIDKHLAEEKARKLIVPPSQIMGAWTDTKKN